jgi:parvulin-like peptidyl-prolyl isomerase
MTGTAGSTTNVKPLTFRSTLYPDKDLLLKKLLSLLIPAALVLAACGSGSNEIAATVDSTTEITAGEVEDLMDPGDSATVPKQQFADFLDFQIKWTIIENAAESDYGITFTEDEIAAEADRVVELNLTEGQTREEFLAENEVTEAFLHNVALQQLIAADLRVALEAEVEVESPTQETVDAQMENAVLALTEVCAKHILVETEDEANDVLVRLEEGEAFEDLAMELSTGPTGENGGDLGCSSPADYVPEFTDAILAAEIDVPTEPVETQFGFHVILVYDRTDPAPEDIPTEEDIIDSFQQTAVDQAFSEWFPAAFAVAVVEVNEKFGTWQTDPVAGVVAPVE